MVDDDDDDDLFDSLLLLLSFFLSLSFISFSPTTLLPASCFRKEASTALAIPQKRRSLEDFDSHATGVSGCSILSGWLFVRPWSCHRCIRLWAI